MSKSFNNKQYALLLLKLGVTREFSFVNQMSKKPLSKRIHFIFKPATIQTKKYLYLIALPLIAASVMAFTKEKTVKVLKEKSSQRVIEKIEAKAYPLTIKNDRDYATWGFFSSSKMSTNNISLNSLTTIKYNGYKYEVNPNSLTENTINDVNKELKKRNLAIIITEKDLDFDGNFEKLGLSIKHLKSGKASIPVIFDMEKCREQGQNGALFVFEAFDRNFEKSQISYFFGSPHLVINKSHLERSKHNTFNINSESSIISHSSDLITYTVYPDKLTLKAAQQAKAYFSENGFKFELKDYESDAAGNLTKVKVEFGDQSRTFDLNKMRHSVTLKSQVNSKPQRMDESMVFEGNLRTKATKISVNNFWFKAIEKSGKYEILSNNNVAKAQILNEKKEIRTVYETNFLGDNPLVIINGKEYPAEILTRLNSENSSSSFSLPNNERAIQKYGEKARDGYYVLDSRAEFIISDPKKLVIAKEIAEKHLNAPKKRVLRIGYTDIDKKEYENIYIHREDKTFIHFGITVPKNNKVLFMINNEQVTEDKIENMTLQIVQGACGEKIDERMINHYGDILKGYDGFFILKTKKN
jgi:hypothetical protein